jgi:phosphatidylserine/phosphatidylglycerophosphate/cardiolipin synthase-like enzyme
MMRREDCADLSKVPDSTLEVLREALVAKRLRTPVTRAGLLDLGINHQIEECEAALAGHSALACLTVLDVAVAERDAARRPAPELVWSGPERINSTARDTAVVLRELFERANSQVILAGYDFTHGSSLLEPLWSGMRDRGLEVHFFLHIGQCTDVLSNSMVWGNERVQEIMKAMWPFGDPAPRVYFDSRSLEPRPYFNMHAKCVIADSEFVLITSANFTRRAHEQNVECGVLLQDRGFALHLARQWMGLIDAGLMLKANI